MPDEAKQLNYFGNPGTNGNKEAWLKYYHETHSNTAKRRALQIKAGGGEVAYFNSTGLVMSNDKGLSFINADDTATGETVSNSVLNDYEEGTWTPSNGTVGIYTDDTRWGYYQKVGNWVTANFGVRFVSNSSAINAYIDGLPYAQNTYTSAGGYRFGGFITYKNVEDNYASSLLIANGGTRIWIYTSTGGNTQLTHFDDKYIRGTLIYKAV